MKLKHTQIVTVTQLEAKNKNRDVVAVSKKRDDPENTANNTNKNYINHIRQFM